MRLISAVSRVRVPSPLLLPYSRSGFRESGMRGYAPTDCSLSRMSWLTKERVGRECMPWPCSRQPTRLFPSCGRLRSRRRRPWEHQRRLRRMQLYRTPSVLEFTARTWPVEREGSDTSYSLDHSSVIVTDEMTASSLPVSNPSNGGEVGSVATTTLLTSLEEQPTDSSRLESRESH